jgi:hypothetical protein
VEVLRDLYVEEMEKIMPKSAEPKSYAEAQTHKRLGLAKADPKDYRELKKTVAADGSVKKQREISPGEKVIHSIFGPPKKRS